VDATYVAVSGKEVHRLKEKLESTITICDSYQQDIGMATNVEKLN